ncbi:hypothetical protein HD554DRAFT_2023385, partial [Boletus coccyginus]
TSPLTQEFADDKYLYSRYYAQGLKTPSSMAVFSFPSDPVEQLYGVGQQACCKDKSLNKKGKCTGLIIFNSLAPLLVYISNKVNHRIRGSNRYACGNLMLLTLRTPVRFVAWYPQIVPITTTKPGNYDTLQQRHTAVTCQHLH